MGWIRKHIIEPIVKAKVIKPEKAIKIMRKIAIKKVKNPYYVLSPKEQKQVDDLKKWLADGGMKSAINTDTEKADPARSIRASKKKIKTEDVA